jgi:ParB family chromosome partitioning protein
MEEKNVKLISIEEIVPNRFQPRQIFGEKELNELADSIKEHGIIQPLIVRPLGDKYEIIAGERRYKAASIAGLYNIPVIVLEKDDNESAELAIIENIQRKDLTPIEEAKSYQKLLNRGLTQEEIAKKLGIAQPTVANKLRLLSLPDEVQEALLNTRISERHARALLRLENVSDQLNLLNRIINEKLNVKQTEEEINKILGIFNVEEKIEEPKEEIELFDVEENNSYDPVKDTNEDIEIKPFEEPSEEDINFFREFNMSNNKEIEKEPSIEEFKDDYIPEIQVIDNEPSEYKYLDVVDKTRNLIDELNSKGYKVKKEEYDMDKEYQIIIRIEK